MHTHRTALLAGVACLATLGLVGAATTTSPATADDPRDHDHAQQRESAPRAASGVVKCTGGQALKMSSRLSAEPFSFPGTSSTDVAVPGAQVAVKGPRSGTDTLLVTFTAESHYTGSGWMGLEIHKDGVPITPFANNGSPFALSSDAAYHGDSAQFCTKLGAGNHTLAVKANTTGGSGEFGWIDDWTLSVIRFD